jgi:hypothetical protein
MPTLLPQRLQNMASAGSSFPQIWQNIALPPHIQDCNDKAQKAGQLYPYLSISETAIHYKYHTRFHNFIQIKWKLTGQENTEIECLLTNFPDSASLPQQRTKSRVDKCDNFILYSIFIE